MAVKLDKPKLLAEAINIISEIVTEVRIKLTVDGMSVVAVDPANVALVIFKLPKKAFSSYDDESQVWTVNLEDLKRVLKRTSTSSSIVFEQEDNKLKITIFDKIKRTFNLSLIELDSEEKNEPDLTFNCKVEMDSTNFSEAVEDCAIVADSCSFSCGSNFFIVEGSGSLNSAKAEFGGDEAKIEGVGKSKYSIEYLLKFIKASRISNRVVVRFSDDYPLRIDFPGDDMGIGFILAPRVEND